MATILVVDDRATNRKLARTVLGYDGHRVIEASEGAEALRMAHQEHPDLVLTDVLMPGMDGYELARELRAAPDTARTPVVFYTANYIEDEARPIAEAYGVARILSKSCDPQTLMRTVNEVLAEDVAAARPMGTEEFAREHQRTVNTKLVQTAQALADTEALFRSMAQSSPVGIFFGGSDGQATYINPRLAQIMEQPVEALLGVGWLGCVSPDRDHDVLAIACGRDDPEVEHRYRTRVTLPGGGDRSLETQLRSIRDDEGALTGFVGTVDDVTGVVEADQRRRTEERRRDLEARESAIQRLESLSRMAGGVAHDFNNILGVILSFEEFVSDALTQLTGADGIDQGVGQQMAGDLTMIRKAGNRAAGLTQQLLAFAARKVIKVSAVDLNQAVREMTEILAPTLDASIQVATALDPGLRRALADHSYLTQILLNLATNARAAMPDGGTLTITTVNNDRPAGSLAHSSQQPRPYVRLSMADTGVGMPVEVLERAVEPFFTTRASGQGTGLGLSTVYGIVNQLGGDLQITSTPGVGTTVVIDLPATDEPAVAPPADTTPPAGGTETILFAEDEDGLRDGVARSLRTAGYTVLAAADGPQALTLAECHGAPIHLLLSDVMMPGMLGGELATRLRRQRPDMRVLFMSGYAGDLMNEQGQLEPGVTVLAKPCTDAALLNGVRTALTGAHRP